ncbi:MAG: hypothetical protein OXU77_16725 [Gammaproteobacteria bacterium]|nr:hypothetical protein [Gammaproteobacteria bacterium]
MAELSRWWDATRDSETFWLEVTDRKDLSANLKSPQTDQKGDMFWGYSILKEVRKGDVIFHYHRASRGIVARSVASGDFWEDDVVWAAHGRTQRAGIQPYGRPGWYVGLESYTELEVALPVAEIRKRGMRSSTILID